MDRGAWQVVHGATKSWTGLSNFHFHLIYTHVALLVKNPPAGDLGLIPGLGRFPGERNGNPLPYSHLGNPMDREAWWATVLEGLKRVGHD